MSKSIANKTLAIAKKQEAERLQNVKERFLAIMRKEFEKRVATCNPWTAGGYYIYEKTQFNEFSLDDLERVCKEVGFKVKYGCGKIGIGIPEWVKGKKRTQAQLMLYWSDIEIKRTIKSRKESAKKMSKEAMEKIKSGDFVLSNQWGVNYEITVKMSWSENSDSREFKEEVERIFAKINIAFLGINNTEWRFLIKESRKES